MNIISKLNFDPNYCNTYVIGEEGKGCVIVDPGYNKNGCLDRYISKHHTSVYGILLTHGHSDHIEGLKTLEHLATVFMMEDEEKFLTNSRYNLTKGLEIDNIQPYLLDDQDEIKLGSYLFKVIATPFHTIGSCCFYLEQEKALFSGDTLFKLGIGRSDLPSGDESLIEDSLAKLALLPMETKVYPGHGPDTSIGGELASNPYFKRR
jgi:glyoxylase-like metal-dependent hydrolase (beta-lactamase superfamily II)